MIIIDPAPSIPVLLWFLLDAIVEKKLEKNVESGNSGKCEGDKGGEK